MKTSDGTRTVSINVAMLLLVVLAAASCMTGNDMSTPIVRPAVDTPDHFVVTSPEIDITSRPDENDGKCLSPLVDPRDGTHLVLVRSSNGQGDYEVLPDRYGTGEGELLRIDCTTLRAIGVARR